ncbi:hypothetical protein EVAR_60651_1 [Eumeta japonica]|uniref:Uncharacterized protein n=1 Tax=Eumeta variegata TaxID=151549 RepID=A0A4C1ZQ92_EUMVA|nr:hypothetical protein EVAR_60651_1 [Eumeta japonica]
MQAARHRGHLGRAERTGTAAPGAYRTLKCPTRRAPCCRRRGACPDIVGTITLIVNRCFGAPESGGPSPIEKTTLMRARRRRRRRRRRQRLADTCCFGCCCWVAGACCLDAVGVHPHPTGGGRLRAWIKLCPRPRQPTLHNSVPPPTRR